MIKILVVGLSKEIGGIENLFYNLLKEKIENCHFDFLAFGDGCAYENYFLSLGYNVYHMPTRKSSLFKFNGNVKRFLLEHNDYDYIWYNTASTSMYQFQYYGKKFTHAKIITHSHGTSIDRNNGMLLFFFNKVLEIINRRKVVENTDLFFCCSFAAGKALYGDKYKNQLILIKNGIDVVKYKFNDLDRRDKRRELGIKEDAMVVALIGRLSPQKNPLKAIKIYEEYLKKEHNSILLIVGDGELKNEVEKAVFERGLSANVKMLGFRKDISELMSCSDILLMPSLFEGLPITAIEAECNGLNCFLSDTITKETQIIEECTFIPLTASDTAWAEKVVNKSKRSTDRIECYKKVYENNYSIDQTRNEIERILQGERDYV